MFNEYEGILLRQRYVELNKRLERLYVPIKPEEESGKARFSLARLTDWLARVNVFRMQRSTRLPHGTIAK